MSCSMERPRVSKNRKVHDVPAGDVANVRNINGLAAAYIVAIDVTRARFPADAFELRLLPPTRRIDLGILSAPLSHPFRVRWRAALVTCDGISKHHVNMTPAGLEPAIPGSVGRCLIHWATGPLALRIRRDLFPNARTEARSIEHRSHGGAWQSA